ncbi:hypothetical protein QTP70_029640 [Hemibagrus guttatus]|uniref:Transcription initiation factor TFIID component TAF4 C-terminal domain-containing protein n=2 Tax=Siluroidei TaxID=1489793 RepID=A0A7J5ZN64_AMEME|nr:hypothetical protein AMELA_G00268650 [Ameiurus melas]KAK3549055.1 hypothetical protein QTP70_029640 [Hemibagrus guttatus]
MAVFVRRQVISRNTADTAPEALRNLWRPKWLAGVRSNKVSGSSVGSPASSLSSSRQFHRQRITRVNLRDFIFYLEQERETSRSLLLYRALLK